MNACYDHNPQTAENNKGAECFEHGISAPSRILVHAKLEMTSLGDNDEQEADAVADAIVMEGKIARSVTPGHPGGGVEMPSHMGSQLSALHGHGSRLYGDLKDRMEAGFGRDFSDVSLHTDYNAAEMSSSIGAKAFTYGSDIYFGRNQFSPDTAAGQHLIAHELAHVAQDSGKVSRQEDGKSNSSSYETEDKLAAIRWYSTNRKHLNPETFNTLYTSQDNKYNLPDELRKMMLDTMDNKGDGSTWNLYKRMVYLFINVSEETMFRALEQREKGEKVEPVNVAIRMSMRSDHNGAFLNGIESLASIPRLIVLQEVDSVKTCTKLLKYIDEVIAPIQNLIICGHGDSDSIILNPEHSFSMGFETTPDGYEKPTQDTLDTLEFLAEVGKLMKEEDGIKKKIIFDACLTASHKLFEDRSQLSFAEFALRYINWKSGENLVAADAETSIMQYSYDTNKNELFASNQGKTRRAFFIGNELVFEDIGLMSPYINDRPDQLYVGFNASDFTGLFRGISFKYYLNRDAAQLKTDLDLLKDNFERRDDLPSEDMVTYEKAYAGIIDIQQEIDWYLENRSKISSDGPGVKKWEQNCYFYFLYRLRILNDLIPNDFYRLVDHSLFEVNRDRSVTSLCIPDAPPDSIGQMTYNMEP